MRQHNTADESADGADISAHVGDADGAAIGPRVGTQAGHSSMACAIVVHKYEGASRTLSRRNELLVHAEESLRITQKGDSRYVLALDGQDHAIFVASLGPLG